MQLGQALNAANGDSEKMPPNKDASAPCLGVHSGSVRGTFGMRSFVVGNPPRPKKITAPQDGVERKGGSPPPSPRPIPVKQRELWPMQVLLWPVGS